MVENYYLTEKYLFENNLLSVIAARCTTWDERWAGWMS
jgi:hypothetical protein